ncbi:hypothetical protein [Amycolatopsis samaneae]|uniref:DUF5709 domain-containing protein n=1 Tax=Amycolatopsis samaneae TaxID=664691 RepID=A0ABW5GWA0_9PSEU
MTADDPAPDTAMAGADEIEPAPLSGTEELDEDELRVDPLEKGMDPPEHWSAADRYGTTPWEQTHPAPLGQRLAEERPDVGTSGGSGGEPDDGPDVGEHGAADGTAADYAGGSVPDGVRDPGPAR